MALGHPSPRRAFDDKSAHDDDSVLLGDLPRSQGHPAARWHRADGQGRSAGGRTPSARESVAVHLLPLRRGRQETHRTIWRRLASCSRTGRAAGRRPPRLFRSFASASSPCSISTTQTWMARSGLRHMADEQADRALAGRLPVDGDSSSPASALVELTRRPDRGGSRRRQARLGSARQPRGLPGLV